MFIIVSLISAFCDLYFFIKSFIRPKIFKKLRSSTKALYIKKAYEKAAKYKTFNNFNELNKTIQLLSEDMVKKDFI